jgi:NAD+ synthase (glutamine-hydrolysing)
MKIGIAQINTKLGDISYNQQKIEAVIQQIGKEADVIVFPEMAISGYPLNDMLDDGSLVKQQKEVIYQIRDLVVQTSDHLKVIL